MREGAGVYASRGGEETGRLLAVHFKFLVVGVVDLSCCYWLLGVRGSRRR